MNMEKIREVIRNDKKFWERDTAEFEKRVEERILDALEHSEVIIDKMSRPCIWIELGDYSNLEFRMNQIGGISVIESKGHEFFIQIN